jgi:hypothetical protein
MSITTWKKSEREKRKKPSQFSLMEKHMSKISEINKGRDPKKAAKVV